MRVYIATRRRPDLVERCVASINGRWPVTVTASLEEDVPSSVRSRSEVDVQMLTPEEDSSNWAARWRQGEDAIERQLDWWVVSDDDAVYPDDRDSVALMGKALMDHQQLGAVTRKSAWPPRNWLNGNEETGITLDGKLGISWAHALGPYIEAGGFDRHLPRIGDYDMGLRLKVCGWEIGEVRSAIVYHKNYNEGGISSREGAADTREARERAAWDYRVHAGRRIAEKYPEGIFQVRSDGFLRVADRRALKALREDYQAGKVRVTADKVEYVDPA